MRLRCSRGRGCGAVAVAVQSACPLLCCRRPPRPPHDFASDIQFSPALTQARPRAPPVRSACQKDWLVAAGCTACWRRAPAIVGCPVVGRSPSTRLVWPLSDRDSGGSGRLRRQTGYSVDRQTKRAVIRKYLPIHQIPVNCTPAPATAVRRPTRGAVAVWVALVCSGAGGREHR